MQRDSSLLSATMLKSLFFLLCLFLSFALQTDGKTRGQRATEQAEANPNAKWWELMDTGPFISDTFLDGGAEGEVAALKGIAIKLGPEEDHTVVFDTETLRMVAGFQGRVKLAGTAWSGKHADNSSLPANKMDYFFATQRGPGVAVNGKWEDVRPSGRGNLPDQCGKYLGLYRHRDGTTLCYQVGTTILYEVPSLRGGSIVRTFSSEAGAIIGEEIELLLLDPLEGAKEIEVTLRDAGQERSSGVSLKTQMNGRVVLEMSKGARLGTALEIVYTPKDAVSIDGDVKLEPVDSSNLRSGGPSLFPEIISVRGRLAEPKNGYAADELLLPKDNPWRSNIRFGAFDFFADGKRVACSTWNGDVWIAEGIDGDLSEIKWRRFASGLFQTLGLKIVDDTIYTHGRDQITRLHDLNGDGEADFYECFNNDVLITKGFHEFAFDLQTDSDGYFYFSKGAPVLSGGRGFSELTDHSGVILRVSPDGQEMQRMAWGLRAPGGIGIGPHGEMTTGENEGSFVPRCKITWSQKDGSSFHGVIPSEWVNKEFVKVKPAMPTDYEKPLCWLPYYVDNSSGSQMWVPENSSWENHAGQMLHLSYGKSSIYRTLVDEVNGQVQGGVYRLPIDLTTAAMRGRFHPQSGHFYVIGFRGWQTNGGTGFQRIRFIEDQKPVPLQLEAFENGLRISFSDLLDGDVVNDPRRYRISKWDYVWGPQYGSGRFSIDDYDAPARQRALKEASKEGENQVDAVEIRAAQLLPDGKSVFLFIPDMTAAMQMEIRMDLSDVNKNEFKETIWNTIHHVRPPFREHGLDLAHLPQIKKEALGDQGLILKTSKGSSEDAVVLDRLALTLDSRSAMTSFIPSAQATFEGDLIVKERDKIAFRLEGRGWASLKLDGQKLIEGQLPLEAGAIELESGPHALHCYFKKAPEGTSRIRLLWSGQDFVWEPVSPSAYRHHPDSTLAVKQKARNGRQLFASAGCVRCHQGDQKMFKPGETMPELLERLPDFENIGNRMNQSWLAKWVRMPENHCPTVAPDEAEDIAAYLATIKTRELRVIAGDAQAGDKLIKELYFEPWAEMLSKRHQFTKAGLQNFLLNPATHAADTNFPQLHLTPKEAADIAAWIEQRQPKPVSPLPGDVIKGQKMVTQRCAVCHQPGEGVSYEFSASKVKEMWETEWFEKGCLSEQEGNAPELRLSFDQKQALFAFKNFDGNRNLGAVRRFVAHEYATRTMERLQCTKCHSGENELPDLSLAGEKFNTHWIEGLLAGEGLKVRPWMQAKMPAFVSRSALLAKGLAYRAGMDLESQELESHQELVKTGEMIAGMNGYGCVACHAHGQSPAIQAFEGQGPNLQVASERLRPGYYHSWMFWPQRFVPTTIMPKYTTNKKQALNASYFQGNAEKQFQALWHWMHSLEGAQHAPLPSKEN
jgi:mono/diheme cytochrome c family protein